MKCTVCGGEWPQDMGFCPQCGTYIDNDAEPPKKQSGKIGSFIKDKFALPKKAVEEAEGQPETKDEKPKNKTVSEWFGGIGGKKKNTADPAAPQPDAPSREKKPMGERFAGIFKHDKAAPSTEAAEPNIYIGPRSNEYAWIEPIAVTSDKPEPAYTPLAAEPVPVYEITAAPQLGDDRMIYEKQKNRETDTRGGEKSGMTLDEKLQKPLNVSALMGMQFLMLIPVLNVVIILRWAFCRNINRNCKNFAWAAIIWFLIVAGVLAAAGYIFEGIYDPVIEFVRRVIFSK